MKTVSLDMVKQAGLLLKREHEERLRLEKEASDLKLEKRAMQVAFREVELGLAEPFKTFGQFHEKVSSLMTENLDVVEKALERGYTSRNRVGTLDDVPSSKSLNVFENWVLNGEEP